LRALLSRRIARGTEPEHFALASLVAGIAATVSPRMPGVATEALLALGQEPTRAAAWRFCRDWWLQRALSDILSYDADRLTSPWAEQHVAVRGSVPREGAILVSVHQFSQQVAAVRAAQLVPQLGLVTMTQPLSHKAKLPPDTFVLPVDARAQPVDRLLDRVFGDRVFGPTVAGRRGLELLRDGGTLVVLPDFYGGQLVNVLGRSIPVGRGAVWWARQSGRPIVPFSLTAPRDGSHDWLLEFAEPISPTYTSLVGALNDIVRRAPTAWMSWRGWHASPRLPRMLVSGRHAAPATRVLPRPVLRRA
jgi:hypothetical protein